MHNWLETACKNVEKWLKAIKSNPGATRDKPGANCEKNRVSCDDKKVNQF